jgi:cAMP-dependent protein kinase regulator
LEARPRSASVRAEDVSQLFVVDKALFDRFLADRLDLAHRPRTASVMAEISYLPPFGHLDPVQLALVAQAGSWQSVAPGTEVVRQGEGGEDFYAVASGQLKVVKDGEAVKTLGVGDHFGEVALLFAAPQAATVRAITPVRLFRLPHEGFHAVMADSVRRSSLRVASHRILTPETR